MEPGLCINQVYIVLFKPADLVKQNVNKDNKSVWHTYMLTAVVDVVVLVEGVVTPNDLLKALAIIWMAEGEGDGVGSWSWTEFDWCSSGSVSSFT